LAQVTSLARTHSSPHKFLTFSSRAGKMGCSSSISEAPRVPDSDSSGLFQKQQQSSAFTTGSTKIAPAVEMSQSSAAQHDAIEKVTIEKYDEMEKATTEKVTPSQMYAEVRPEARSKKNTLSSAIANVKQGDWVCTLYSANFKEGQRGRLLDVAGKFGKVMFEGHFAPVQVPIRALRPLPECLSTDNYHRDLHDYDCPF